jgi:cold shock CspA family protein
VGDGVVRQQGKLIDWYDERGYGFVVRHGDTKKVFVHISEFEPGQRRPVGGDALIYDVVPGKGGSLAAANIVLPETIHAKAGEEALARRRDTQA